MNTSFNFTYDPYNTFYMQLTNSDCIFLPKNGSFSSNFQLFHNWRGIFFWANFFLKFGQIPQLSQHIKIMCILYSRVWNLCDITKCHFQFVEIENGVFHGGPIAGVWSVLEKSGLRIWIQDPQKPPRKNFQMVLSKF